MKKEEDFDDIFKKGLGEGAGPAYREEDWNALAAMLDTPKKKLGLIFWIPVLSSAAILLIAFGWWVLRPENAQNSANKTQGAYVASLRKNETGSADSKDTSVSQKAIGNSYAKSVRKNETGRADSKDTSESQKTVRNSYAQKLRKNETGSADRNDSNSEEMIAERLHQRKHSKVIATDVLAANEQNTVLTHRKSVKSTHGSSPADQGSSDEKVDNASTNYVINQPRDTVNLIAYANGLTIGQYRDMPVLNSLNIQAANMQSKRALLPIKQIKPVIKANNFRPQYALSVIGAPEVNGVNSLSQTSAGTNLGLLFSVELFKKIYVSTGAMYSIKPYNSSVSSYDYNASYVSRDITTIDAHCRVLDIPLNIDYQFYNKHLNRLSVGTGLSSYIMLYEHYQYNYGNSDIAPFSKTIPQTNKYFLGVLNLQATYSRQVASNVSLSLQPYMKLPLTGIGATGAKLQTAGVAIGLNWNLSSVTNR